MIGYLVIYTPKLDVIAGRTPEYRTMVSSLEEIKNLDFDEIRAVFEINRIVPISQKHKEEKEVIKKKPYYEIGGVEIDRKTNPNPFGLLLGSDE